MHYSCILVSKLYKENPIPTLLYIFLITSLTYEYFQKYYILDGYEIYKIKSDKYTT